jgi:cleavage and polyadenylation specificity factor subunit 3
LFLPEYFWNWNPAGLRNPSKKKRAESIPVFELIKDEPLDFVFISHAHQDHIGALPFLLQEFPHAIIYSTYQTKEIAELVLHNAANIISLESQTENSFRNYSHNEIELLVRFMRDIEYNNTIELKGLRHAIEESIKITFTDAGHILGSASIILEIAGNKIIYTGDINIGSQKIMAGAEISQFKNATALITETTYGSTDSAKIGSWNSESKRFAKSANQILNAGGSILVPVFALGKTQELLAAIYGLMKRKFLTDTFIYTGGIGKEISNIYDRNRYLVKYSDTDLILKDIPQQNIYDVTDMNVFSKNPGIVLASSGMMLENTTSYRLMKHWIKQKHFGIFSVGYMDADTPGYKIMNAVQNEEIDCPGFNQPQKILCSIERFSFPSHSRREDLILLIEKTNPEKIILVHGEASSKDWIGYRVLKNQKDVQLYSAEVGKALFIGN